MKLRVGGAFSVVLSVLLTASLVIPVEALAIPFSFQDPTPTPTAEPSQTPEAPAEQTPIPEESPTPDGGATEGPSATPSQNPVPTNCAPVPSDLVAVAGNNTAELSWTTPGIEFAVSSYEIVLNPGERKIVVPVADTLESEEDLTASTTLDGLRNGVEYSLRLTAINDCGAGEQSQIILATPTSGADGTVGQLVVKYEAGVNAATREDVTSNNDQITTVALEPGEKLGSAMQVLNLSESVTEEQAAVIAETLEADSHIAWVEPNVVVTTATLPSVARYSLPAENTEVAEPSGGFWDFLGAVQQAITGLFVDEDMSKGEGTVVAVIDTGSTSHPDMGSKVLRGYDFVSDDSTLSSPRIEGADPVSFDGDYVDAQKYGPAGWDDNPTDSGDWRGVTPLRDSSWHGTVMSGIIAADENPEHGTVGIAPGTTILPVRALSWRGGLASDIAASIIWASGGSVPGVADNPRPADVINLSFTVEGLCSPIFQDAINGAISRGSVVVAAAGNAASDVLGFAPANCDNVITVAATDKTDKRASYSNFGAGIDIAAPGDGVSTNGQPGSYSLTNSGKKEADKAHYAYAQGTSVSAAFISGALARLKSENPTATPSELSTLLIGEDVIRPFAGDTCDVDLTIECGPGISSVGFVQIAATTPTNFSGSGTPTALNLSWASVAGATSYTVRWGVAANALTNVISSIPATATLAAPVSGSGPTASIDGGFTNGYRLINNAIQAGQTYYVTVEAVDGAGTSSATSAIAIVPRYAYTTTFGYTGAVQVYTVPAGVNIIEVSLRGAAGGTYIPGSYVGGAGGQITGRIAVTPGETLYFYVGGVGRNVGETSGGGFNGGAIGAQSYGAGGGGATDIRRGATAATSTRVIIAGGGGGAAYYSGGGGGGGTTGGTSTYAGSGAGGTQTTGGANFSGSVGTGNSGGGGGGGYFGGLGGSNLAGGGGGSSFASPSAVTGVIHARGANGTNTGDGAISVTVPTHLAAPVPTNVSVSGWQRSNTIQWTQVLANAATGYRIKWGTTPDLTEPPILITSVGVTSYTHTARTFGATYYYSVSAVLTDNSLPCTTSCYSADSPTVSVVTPFTQTATFEATGAVQTFTVPAGVNWIQVDATGAAGGSGSGQGVNAGGKGGRVQATMPVTPGEVLNVYVGGSGNILSRFPRFNGGGVRNNTAGGDGGGATDIRRGGTAVANRILVAGAGGGGSFYSAGANGGGINGADGLDNATIRASGGTQNGPGDLGVAGTQTAGASAPGTSINSGGAGAGYWGGNAGSVNNTAGAGGSSWTTPAVTPDGRYVNTVTHTQGFASATGDGSLRITYATTPEMPIPSSFEATGFQSQVALKWVASRTDAVTGYKIKWGSTESMTETPISITGASINSYNHTGRSIGTTYYYSIAAVYTDATQTCNTSCLSAYSPVAFTTPVFTEDLKFGVTGTVQQWTVPAGVTWIQVDAAGAAGESSSTGWIGGKGGRVQAIVPVTPGEVLNLYVGGNGGLSKASRWNGGGLTNNATGGNGGGGTDIRRAGTAVANRILVAGGGGGASYYSAGGAGGGLVAVDGRDNASVTASAGNQIGPIPGAVGTPGTLGVGASAVSTSINSAGAGGGYWGGNAGVVNNSSGGGGSSWTTPSGVASDDARTIGNIVHTQAYSAATGDGYITITVPTRAYPTGVTATGWQGYNTIQWDPSELSGATAYKVYGGASPNPTTLLATVNKGTEFYTHSNVTIGTTYYYRVTIVANGVETEKSAEVSAVPVPTKDLVFPFSGANQTWTVPAGVTWIQVDVKGAAGDNSSTGELGGKGGRVQATIPVTPGEVLNLYVGNGGGAAVTPGWNGGGTSNNATGGAGGGASDIRRGGIALTNRIVIAGGGGGASYYSVGGAGGGLRGADGRDNANIVATGGTQVGPIPGALGTPGTLGVGASAVSTSINSAGAGGGFWGGNAGVVNNSSGGGGSSWTIPTALADGRIVRAVTHTQGFTSATGAGSIRITIPSSATPTGLVGAPGNNSVAVSWNASDATGLVGYKLYRGTTPNPTVQIGTLIPAGTIVYNDTSAINGTTYYYRVAAVLSINGANVDGPLSGDITAMPSALTAVPTFAATGGVQTWTVPAGVSWVQVDASGASGGPSSSSLTGGKGGRVQAAIPVTPGDVLYLYVGTAGGSGTVRGWNGGGAGNNTTGGGGGGATDIRRGGTTMADRILVAGGGGGASYYSGGGAGGGLVGASGFDNAVARATGGGQTGPIPGTVNLGTQSTLGVGSTAISSSINSAGGGGGYWGGNSGVVNNSAGGGGSSWTLTGAAGIIHTQGYKTGAGSLTLSYSVDSTIPTVTAVTTPQASGVYRQEMEITVNVAFSESVLVAGTPTLTLNAGTRRPVLTYKSGSGTQNLTFVYRVAAGDVTPTSQNPLEVLDIDSINALSLNGGDISDRVGNVADVTLPIPGTNDSLAGDKRLIIDGSAPVAPVLLQAAGSGSVQLDWNDNSESDLKEYRIYAGTSPTSLAQLSSVLAPTSQFEHFAVARGITYYYYVTAVDLRGNESAPSAMVSWGLPIAGVVATPAVLADSPTSNLRPVVRGSTSPNATVRIFDAGVEIGSVVAGSDGNYSFTPTADLSVATHSVTARASLNGDTSGMSLTTSVVIETTAPTVTSVLRQDPVTSATSADELTFRVTFSEGMRNVDAADFTASGTTAPIAGISAVSSSVFDVRVSGGDLTALNGTVGLGIASNSVMSDIAGNALTSRTAATSQTYVLDNNFPTVTITTSRSALAAGTTATLTFTLSKPSSDFSISDISATKGTLGSWVATSSTVYSAVYTPTAGMSGSEVLIVRGGTFVDITGLANTAGLLVMTLDTQSPTVTNVSATTANGAYTAGAVVDLSITFDEPVSVVTGGGIPALTLSTGATNRSASYLSGSGTNTLTFRYTVVAGDTSADLNYLSTTSLSANGGTLRDAAGNNATLTLPVVTAGTAGALATNAAIVIDTAAPAAPTALVLTPAGSLTANALVATSTNMTASATIVAAAATGGSAGLFLGATLIATDSSIAAGDTSVTFDLGKASAPALQAAITAGGAVTVGLTDAAGNVSPASSAVTLTVDYVVPTVTITTSSSALIAGQNSAITFTLSENSTNFVAGDVTVSGGTLSAFAGSGKVYTATFTPAANSNTAAALSVAAGVFADAVGNVNTTSNSLSIDVDTAVPTVTGVSSGTANGLYGLSAVINITVTFSEIVTVSTSGGVPSLLLETGITDHAASYVSGSGTNTLTYKYTVLTGDSSADLNYQNTSALALNSGTIKDSAGNSASLALPAVTAGTAGSLATNKAIVVDTIAPTAPTSLVLTPQGSTVANALLSTTTNLTASARIVAAEATNGTATLLLGSTVLANDSSIGATDTSLDFNLGAASAGELQALVAAGGNVTVLLTDAAGNTSVASSAVVLAVDYIAPSLSISSSSTSLVAGQTATVTFTFSEPASTSGAGAFTFSDIAVTGGTLGSLSPASPTSTTTVYTATFTPAVATAGATGSISVNSGTFTDATGNAGTSTNSVSIAVDTVAPTVVKFESSAANGSYREGDNIAVTATLSEPVRAGATLRIILDASNTPVLLSTVVAGTLLSGEYIVASNEISADLTVSSFSVVANSVLDAAGNALSSSTMPTGTNNIAGAKSIVIDSQAPTIPSVPTISVTGGTVVSGVLNSTNTNLTATATMTAGQATGGKAELLLGNAVIATDNSIASGDTIVNFDIGSSSTGSLQAAIAAGGVLKVRLIDLALNTSDLALTNGVNLQADYIKPIVGISSNAMSLLVGESATIDFLVSENVTSFDASDITVAGGALTGWTATDATHYSATFTPTAGVDSATPTLSVAAGAFTDAASNPSAASATLSFTADTRAPQVTRFTSTTPDGSYSLGSPINITALLSEVVRPGTSVVVTLNTGAFLTLTTSTASNKLSGTYIVAAGQSTSDLSVASFSYAAGTIKDVAGNTMTSRAVPTAPDNLGDLTAISFDVEAPTTPTALSFTSEGGTAVAGYLNSTNTNLIAQASITPGQASGGKAELLLGNTVIATDSTIMLGDQFINFSLGAGSSAQLQAAVALAGNLTARVYDVAGNVSGSSQAVALALDYFAPTVAVASDVSTLKSGEFATIAFTLSDNSTDFDSTDVIVTGGSLRNFTGSGKNYTGEITPTSDSITAAQVSVGGGAFPDAQGNPNTASANTVIAVDTRTPTVSAAIVTSTNTSATQARAGNKLRVTLTSSEVLTVSGTPRVALTIGSTSVWADYVSGSGSTSLVFSYTVTAGDTDNSGGVAAGSLSLNGGSLNDSAGNQLNRIFTASSNLIEVDTTAPADPVIASVSTRTTTPTLSGTAEPFTHVDVYDSSVNPRALIASTTADGQGAWIVTSATLTEGDHQALAVSIDAAGNASNDSIVGLVRVDLTAPVAPILIDVSDDTGSSASDRITSDETLTVTGTTEAGAVVELFNGSTSLGAATANSSGGFSITSSTISGQVSLTVKATDAVGNTSPASASRVYNIDTSAPADPSVTGPPSTRISSPVITGTAEAHATVEIRQGFYPLGTVRADSSGNWTLVLTSSLADGTYSLTARATDSAGNTSGASSVFSLLIDSTPPALSLATVAVDDTISLSEKTSGVTLTGFVEAGASVAVTVGTAAPANATISGTTWSYILSSSEIGTGTSLDLFIRASDSLGNSSIRSRTVALNLAAVAQPSTPDLLNADDTGSSASDDVTTQRTPRIEVAFPTSGGSPATVGQTLTLLSGGGAILGQRVLTSGDISAGSVTFTVASLNDNTYSLTATLFEAGNTSVPSSALSLKIDNRVPDAPGAPTLLSASDSGISQLDGVTNETAPTVRIALDGTKVGGTAIDVGDSIEVYEGGVNGTRVALAWITSSNVTAGYIDITLQTQASGTYSLSAIAVAAAGPLSPASPTTTVVIDDAGQAAPGIPDMLAADDSGASDSDNATSKAMPRFAISLAGTSAVANDVVQLRDSNGTTLGSFTLTATNISAGTVTFPLTQSLAQGSSNVSARIVDRAGNIGTSSSAVSLDLDTYAPTAGTVALVSSSDSGVQNDFITFDSTPSLSFSSLETGSSVVATARSAFATSVSCTSTNFGCTLGTLSGGSWSITIVQVDAAGNESIASAPLSLFVDVTAPVAPSALVYSVDTGASSSDGVTNDTSIDLSGSAEAGSSVAVTVDGTPAGTVTADAAGTWLIPGATFATGVHDIRVTAADVAANQSSVAATSISVDTTAPAAPVVVTSGATSDTTPTITGSAEALSSVEITDGVRILGTVSADSSGNWSFTAGTLSEATHSISARATDIAGNVSVSAVTQSLQVDATAPVSATITALMTNQLSQNITGTAEVGSSIELKNGQTLLGTAVADSSGSWSLVAALGAGAYSLTVVSTDAAGNATPATLSQIVTVDRTAPPAPAITPGSGNATHPTITGTAEAGSTVILFEGGVEIGRGTANNSGQFSIVSSTALGTAQHQLVATATDVVGNTSADSASASFVIDVTAPASPVLDALSAYSLTPTLSGTAEAGATVTLYDGTVLLGSTIATGGNFSFTVSSALSNAAHQFTAVATDVAGNTGLASAAVALSSAWAAVLTGADSTDNNNVSVTAVQYNALGVTAIDSAAQASLLNDVVDVTTASAVDTVTELSALARIVSAIFETAAGGTPNPALTATDFAALGVTGVTSTNLADVLAAIAATPNSGSGISTLSSLRTLAANTAATSASRDSAIAVITVYAAGQNDVVPTTTHYSDALVTGVTSSHLAALNTLVAHLSPSATDTTAELQAAFDVYQVILDGADATRDGDVLLTEQQFVLLDLRALDAAAELSLANSALDGLSTADVDTWTELSALANAAVGIATQAAGGTPAPALTAASFAALGITGVNSANLASVIAQISSGTDTVAELQSISNQVVATQLASSLAEITAYDAVSHPTPTPSEGTFANAGISGVTSANVTAINTAVDAISSSAGKDSIADVQAVVDLYSAVLAGADGNGNNNNLSLTTSQFAVLGLYSIDTAAEAALLNEILDATSSTAVDTFSELSSIAQSVSEIFALAAGQTVTPAPSVAELQALGFTSVTSANIADVLAAIAATANDGSGVDSHSELSAVITQTIAAAATRDAAVDIIATYSGSHSDQVPSLSIFLDAGVIGVGVSNITMLNTAFAALPASATDSAAEVQAAVDAYLAIMSGADGTRNSNVQLVVAQYAALGLLGINSTPSVSLMNRILDTSSGTSVDTYAELSSYSTVVGTIFATAAAAGVSTPLTPADFTLLGLNGVTSANIASVRAAIAATSDDGTGVDTLIELQGLIDQVVANALSAALQVLTQYSGQNGAAPDVTDFANAGITGVDVTNVAAINSFLAALPAGDKATAAQIQALVNNYNTLLAGADSDAGNNNVTLTASQYSLLGLTAIDSAQKAGLLNDVIDGLGSTAVDSQSELNALANAVAGLFVTASGGTSSPAMTPASLTALGISGVTTDNLSAILAAIAATPNDGSGVDTLAELSGVISAAVNSFGSALNVISSYDGTNSVPTLTDYANAGLTQLSASDLSVMNSFVADLPLSATDSAAELEQIYSSLEKVIGAADGTANGGASTLTALDYARLGLAGIDTAVEVELLNSILDYSHGIDVDTSAEVVHLASIVTRLLIVAAGGQASPALTVEDFAAIGVAGVTEENLSLMIAAVAATTDGGSGIAPLTDLQNVVADAITAAEQAALSSISSYTGSNTAPTLNDYVNAGVSGLSSSTVAGFNSFAAALSSSQLDTPAKIQAAVDAYMALRAAADGLDNDNAQLNVAEFSALGLSSTITSTASASLLNDVLDAKNSVDVATYSELSSFSSIVSRVIATAANPAAQPALSIADFTALGITGVTPYNLTLIISAIGATSDNGSEMDSLAEIQSLVTETSTQALADSLAKLAAYDGTSATSVPTVNDYLNAGVTGVTVDNLNYVNTALVQMPSSSRDSTGEIQSIVNPFLAILAGADGLDNNNMSLTPAQYVSIGLTTIDTAAKADLMNQVIDQSSPQSVDSMNELLNIGLIIRGIFVTATGGTPVRDLTPEHFATLGLVGVTGDNLELVLAAIEQTNDNTSGVDTMVELQSLITAVAHAQEDALALISGYEGTGTEPVISDYLDAGVTGISGSSADLINFFNSYISLLPSTQTDSMSEIQAIFDACKEIFTGADAVTDPANYFDGDNDNVNLTIEQYQLLGFRSVLTQADADAMNDFIDMFDITMFQDFNVSPEITAVAPADGALDLTALLDADPTIADEMDSTFGVSHFVYSVSADDGSHWSEYGFAGTNPDDLAVTGLTNGVEYSVKIRAVSPVASSLPSPPEVGVPVAAALPAPEVIGRSEGNSTPPTSAEQIAQMVASAGGTVIWTPTNLGLPQLPELRGVHLEPGVVTVFINGAESQAELSTIGGSTLRLELPNGVVLNLASQVAVDASSGTRYITQAVTEGVLMVVDGHYVQVSASGFASNSVSEMWLFSKPALLGALKADTQGNVATRVQVPGGTPAGMHTLEIRGIDASGVPLTIALGITVVSPEDEKVATAEKSQFETGSLAWLWWVAVLLFVAAAVVIVLRRRVARRA